MAGTIVMVDAHAPKDTWPNKEKLEGILQTAVACGGATFLESRVIPLPNEKSRPDSPPGGTAWVGLDESHITLHWYELENKIQFALDVFTCGENARPDKIAKWILRELSAKIEWNTRFLRMMEC